MLNVKPIAPARLRKQIERFAELKAAARAIEDELDELKEIFTDLGDGTYEGKVHKVIVTTSEVARLDNKLVKSVLTPAEIVACTVTSVQVRIVDKPL